MSKDIRSYFGVTVPKKNEDPPEKKKTDGRGHNKKKRAVIDSDSDEEIFVQTKKINVEIPQSKKKPPKEPKKEPAPVKAADIFGSAPVKMVKRKESPKKSHPQVVDLEDDAEFEEALHGIDESAWSQGVVTPAASNSSKTEEVEEVPCSKRASGKTERSSPRKKSSTQETSSPREKSSTQEKSSPHEKSSPLKKSPYFSEEKSTSKTEKAERKIKKEENDKPSREKGSKSSNNVPEKSNTPSPTKEKASTSRTESTSGKSQETLSKKREASEEHKERKQPRLEPPSTGNVPVQPSVPAPSGMWVDKYKPSSIKQIIGQQGDSSNVKKLLKWLLAWHSNHGSGVNKKLVKPSPWAKDDTGAFFKAALLSGPPGVGKTTTAHLVCKEAGMDVVEFNASDTRSKKLMNQEVTELLSSKSLLPFFQSGGSSASSSKHVLVMDEVDGMAGNEDRGGVQELISLIKNSKCPVICMCNDRNHPKIRSLANYCFDLRFYKPRVEQIRGAMMSVCFKEKVQITPAALDEVIAGTNCDIRQVLHNLSMWSSADKKMTQEQTKIDANAAKKNIKLSPWDSIRKVFSAEDHKTMSIMDKSDLFFHDYNIMSLFVQENYLIASPHAAKKTSQVLKQIAKAATSISYGDLIERRIRSTNSWSLLPVQAMYSSVVPGDFMEGHLSGQIQFPSWLGKNSKRNKMDRLLQELQTHMRLSISGGKQAVNLEYLPHIQNAVIAPLVSDGAQGVPQTLQAMQDYFLTRDDLDSLFELNQWPGQLDPMAKVDSKVKAALTRAYNKTGIMTPYTIEAPIKKRKGVSSADTDDLGGLEGEEGVGGGSEGSSDEDDGMDAMIKTKKPTKKETEAGPSSSGSGRGRGGGRGRGAGSRGRGKK